jgi:hypothetical protein
MDYLPGQPMPIAGRIYNLWTGWGCEPRKGPVDPWSELLDYLFEEESDAIRKWVEQWFAYPLQHPGVKMYSAVVNMSVLHGTGKSLLGSTMMRIYGRNGTTIKEGAFESSFNEWAVNRQFVMGEEITSGERRNKAVVTDLLKALIVQEHVEVNQKYMPKYVVADCINYYFTTNHPDAFFLEDSDRRFLINEIKRKPLPFEWYRDTYVAWLDKGGAAAILHHLLHFDLTGFDPHAHAPMTKAKARMMQMSRSDLGNWVRELAVNPGAVLPEGLKHRDLVTTEELLMVFDSLGSKRISVVGMGRELRRAGIPLACGGQQVRLRSGRTHLLNVIRNKNQWLDGSPAEAADHIAGIAKKAKY